MKSEDTKEMVRMSVAGVGKFHGSMLRIFLPVLQWVMKSRTLVIHCCAEQSAPFVTLSTQRQPSSEAQWLWSPFSMSSR